MTAKLADVILTAKEAAEAAMVTPRRIQQLAKDGWIAKTAHGRYRALDVLQGVLAFREHETRAQAKSPAEERVAEARAREIEQRIAIRDAELVDITEHHAVFDEAFGMLKAELIGTPAAFTRDPGERRRLEELLRRALNRAADRFEAASRKMSAGRAAPANRRKPGAAVRQRAQKTRRSSS